MATKFKSWDSPASSWGSKPKKYIANVSNSPRISSWQDLDWEELANNCDNACKIAKTTAEAERLERYKAFIKKQEDKLAELNPEAGSYEGNLSDKYPLGSMSLEENISIKQEATSDIIDTFCSANNLKYLGIQLLPLIITHLGQFKLTTMSGEDYDPMAAAESIKAGKTDHLISSKSYYLQVFSRDQKSKGLYYFIMYDSRSKYLETQYKGPAKNFSALVPLVLYAYKLIKGIPYSHWDREELPAIVNPKLAMAMLYEDEPPTVEDVIKSRDIGLSVKTGDKKGQVRDPSYTFKLYGSTPISHLPDYVQVMYSQIWVAHPSNRTKYMVLDPRNWDKMPDCIIPTEVVTSTKVLATSWEKPSIGSSDWL